MTAISRALAKTYFETSDEPTQQQFSDFLDSIMFKTESGYLAVAGLQDFNAAATYYTGMTCIKDNAVYEANKETGGTWVDDDWDNVFSGVFCARTVIEDADIKTLYDRSVDVLPALGVGIVPKIIGGSVRFMGTTPYADNVILYFRFKGCAVGAGFCQWALLANHDSIWPLYFSTVGAPSASDDQELTNTEFEVYVPAGNPTGGAAGQKIIVRLYYIKQDYSEDDTEDSGSGSVS